MLLCRLTLKHRKKPVFVDYCKLFAVGILGTAFVNWVIPFIPEVSFLNATGWRVILGSILGILLGLTPLHWLKGAKDCANVFLYMSLCVAMSYSDLSQCTSAPWHLQLQFLSCLLLCMLFGLGLCKLLKLDCFTAAVGFMANFGGTSSAPAIAAAYNENWIGFGILLGFFGDLIGTAVAIGFRLLLTVSFNVIIYLA